MNILVVTENYLKGGLETQVATFYNELKEKNNFYFCVTSYEENGILNSKNIYTGFHFTYNVTIVELCQDVDRMVKLIEEKKIDVIQVHPFFAIYAVWFAANITGVRIVYTYHGLSSLNYNLNLFDEALTEYIFNRSVSTAICVNKFGEESFKTIGFTNIALIPNPVDTKKYKKSKVLDNKKWALVSRLDIDKSAVIYKLFDWLDDLDIDELDIYGDGNEMEQIQEAAKKVNKKVNFLGYKVDLYNELADKYNGIIGLGRCALEGLAMGYPVIFAGYGKISGLIDKKIYQKAKEYNFVNEDFPAVTKEELNEQLKNLKNKEQYDLSKEIVKDFDIKDISEKYIKTLEESPKIIMHHNIIALYKELKETKSAQKFHTSRFSEDICKKHIMPFLKNMQIRANFLTLEEVNAKTAEAQQLAATIEDLKAKMATLQARCDELERLNQANLDYLSSNLNTKWIIRNDMKKIKGKFTKTDKKDDENK